MPERKSDSQRPNKPKTAQLVTKPSAFGFQRRWLWMGLSLGAVAILSATAGAFLAMSLITRPFQQYQFTPEEAAVFNRDTLSRSSIRLPELTRPVNILVLGMSVLPSDLNNPPESRNLHYARQMHSVEGQSDTILLVRFDPQTRHLTFLSIPRDTPIVLEKYGIQKINNANVLGGPALAASEVSKLLGGVGIDRYVRVNVLAVGKLVDALGGVTIYVPKDMKYTDESQHLFVDLKQGKQHLNGNMTMQLLRYRHDLYGDLGRMQRQQLVIRALMSQALNLNTIARIPQLLQTIKSDIDTNLSVEEIIALAGFATQIDRKQVQGLIVPGDFNGNGQHEISYWLPDHRRIQAMMANYFDLGYGESFVVDAAHIRVSIQDSTHNPKAVPALVKMLQKAGYQHLSIDAPLTEPLAVTHIVAQRGDSESASKIYQALGFGEVRVETSGTLYSDVTIQLGLDGLHRFAESKGAITY